MSKKLIVTYRHLLYFSAFCIVLLIFRGFIFGRFSYLFLIWNLFLAWIPFHVALFAAKVAKIDQTEKQTDSLSSHQKPYIFIVFLLLGWLVFFPNAPYIVTDFVHLRYSSLDTFFVFWFQAALFFFFAIGGLLYAVCSLQLVEKILTKMFGKVFSLISLMIIFLLTGFGIYIGRFLRWNSWDLVFSPLRLWHDLVENITLSGFEYPLLITLVYAAITGFSFFFFQLVVRLPVRSSSEIFQRRARASGHFRK